MAFQMGVDSLSGFKVIPPGIYTIRLNGFKPKFNKNKDGVNFNAQMEVINHPEHDGAKLFETLSSKAGFMQMEFAHGFGLPMEDTGNGQYVIPGNWDGDPATFKEADPTTWKYDGPLLGRTAQVEVAVDTYEGKENNKIKQYIWPEGFIPPYEATHNTDLLRKK